MGSSSRWLQTIPSFPSGSVDKESTAMQETQENMVSIPGLERSPGGGHGKPLQYSYLESPIDRGTWWATVHTDAKSQTRRMQLSMQALIPFFMYFLNISSCIQLIFAE